MFKNENILQVIKNQLNSIPDLNHQYLCNDLYYKDTITFEFNQKSVDPKEELTKIFKNISFEKIGIYNYIKNKEWAKGISYKVTIKINKLNHIYQLSQFNTHFDSSSRVEFGYFESYDEAYNAMLEGFEELYKGFKENFYSNGSNQWRDDSHSFGVMINEIDLNHFREI